MQGRVELFPGSRTKKYPSTQRALSAEMKEARGSILEVRKNFLPFTFPQKTFCSPHSLVLFMETEKLEKLSLHQQTP
ncbi:hypothetical protein CEXT_199271 [Caerostris extrusa]|uniref:Uncharacterized protein n=1 Tax=Caerostris extrusa TaxID=172846 RepID=A0AAV4WT70_CAEEX|nr:hypothetical protein CEXT_199271 [Caerostris extrusa]